LKYLLTQKASICIEAFVNPMVRLSNHFLEDLEKLANIYKGKVRLDWQEINIDNQEFKTKYSTAEMIEHDKFAKKRKRGVHK